MASFAVLARMNRLLTCNLAKQRLGVSTTTDVQYTIGVSLLRLAKSGLARQLFTHGTIDTEVMAPNRMYNLCSCLTWHVAWERRPRDRYVPNVLLRRHSLVGRRLSADA
jgi:hypothetical protein